ncbi:class I SAM-dependent methyltransferase [Neobacillus mesonae]|nr:class I SAM-dependent methyltransferase [Neobacillus mesonae]
MLITTGDTNAKTLAERAIRLAEATGSSYVPRNKASVAKLAEKYGDEEIVVVVTNGVRLIRPGEPLLEFHPSMGFVRAKRVLKGESDPMLEAADFQKGDSVLDCTAGLGTDALVFAVAAGEEGHVIACESSRTLYTVLLEGLKYYRSGRPEVDQALRSIEMKHKDHLELLRSMEDNSVDVVYFDPMFREPVMDSSAIRPLRKYANSAPLEIESIAEAKRVAKKRVVLKEKKDSGEFARLGFKPLDRAHSKTVYGVIEVDRNV